jgi:bacteriorhodopsin
VTAILGAATFVIMALSFSKTRANRLFHYITAAITLVASIAYFCMGSNLGWTAIQVEFERNGPKVHGNIRQIFYVRYIDWFITTPLLLLDLLLTCGIPTPTILYVILMDEIMIVTGLVGALVKSSYKWGFYTFGCAAFLFVAYSGKPVCVGLACRTDGHYSVVFEGRTYARALGADINRTYTICGAWTIGLGFLYPIAWVSQEKTSLGHSC